MPQTNALLDWTQTYPIDCPTQKPGGVLVGTVRTASAAVWATGTVTITVPAVADAVGTQVWVTVVGFAPTGYNGRFRGTIASSTTITYSVASNPGTATTFGQTSYVSLVAGATPNASQLKASQIKKAPSKEIPPQPEPPPKVQPAAPAAPAAKPAETPKASG